MGTEVKIHRRADAPYTPTLLSSVPDPVGRGMRERITLAEDVPSPSVYRFRIRRYTPRRSAPGRVARRFGCDRGAGTGACHFAEGRALCTR